MRSMFILTHNLCTADELREKPNKQYTAKEGETADLKLQKLSNSIVIEIDMRHKRLAPGFCQMYVFIV